MARSRLCSPVRSGQNYDEDVIFRFNKFCDGDASKRICDFMIGQEKRDFP